MKNIYTVYLYVFVIYEGYMRKIYDMLWYDIMVNILKVVKGLMSSNFLGRWLSVHFARNGITKCVKALLLVIMKEAIWRNGTAVIARKTRCQLNYDSASERK